MLHVETQRSESGRDEPAVIFFGSRRVAVQDIIDRWWGPEHRWWKARTAEGDYILRLHEPSGTWELAAVVGDRLP